MKRCLFINGIGNYGIIQNFYALDYSNNYFYILMHYLAKNNILVEYVDVRTFDKKELQSKINNVNPDSIIMNWDKNNCTFLERFNINPENIHIYYLSYEKGAVTPDRCQHLFIDENISIEDNIFNIIEKLNLSSHSTFKYDPCYWDIIKEKNLKAVSVIMSNISTKNNIQSHNLINNFILEIEHLFKSKQTQCFHVKNQSFFHNNMLLKGICKKINELPFSNNFIWACTILPDIIDEDALKYLSSSRLKKIHIEVECTDTFKVNRKEYEKDVILKFINNMYNNGVVSIVIDYVIGIEYKNEDLFKKLIAFSEELFNQAPGAVEFNIDNSFDYSELEPSFYYNIMSYKKYIFRKWHDLAVSVLPKLSLQEKINHIEINHYGLISQYHYYFYAKSLIAQSFHFIQNLSIKYSFDISDNLSDYSLFCYITIYFDENSKPYIYIDSFCNENKSNQLSLNKFEYDLLILAKRYKTIYQIIAIIAKTYTYTSIEQKVIQFYKKIESYGGILFIKYLN